MTGCGCGGANAQTESQRRTLRIALILNATMFVVGMAAGIIGQSSGLIADALDMLGDASAYGVALLAIHRGMRFKARSATLSGVVVLALGAGVILDAGRRAIFGSEPESLVMMAIATMSLVVNSIVLYLLARQENKEVHLRASYICTRADVVANLAVIGSGLIVLLTGIGAVDLVVGAAIGLYVMREALEILEEARKARGELKTEDVPDRAG